MNDKSNLNGVKFLSIGELLLRLTPPGNEKIRVANRFDASFGGAETNIAVALANLGVDSSCFTVVPSSSIGKAAIRYIRSNDVHCSPCIYVDGGRLGIYFLEEGFGVRASKVTYDRENSAFALFDYTTIDWEQKLKGFTWLHISGITPALSPNCRTLTMLALKAAKKLGITVSFDCNYRSALWSWEDGSRQDSSATRISAAIRSWPSTVHLIQATIWGQTSGVRDFTRMCPYMTPTAWGTWTRSSHGRLSPTTIPTASRSRT